MNLNLPVMAALAVFTTFTSTASFAQDAKAPLFTATSDAFDGRLELSLAVDANSNATGFVYTEDGKDTVIPLTSLSDGIVLYQTSGKDVVTLVSKTFNTTTGGDLTLRYLNNGLSGTYKNFVFTLSRQGQSWIPTVMNSRGIPQSFVSAYLKAKKLLGKVVGIDSITVQ